jgi:hypothetical protein
MGRTKRGKREVAGQRRNRNAETATVSYLLRVWRVRGEEGIVLRAALKSRPDGEWLGFASLEALVAALRAEMEEEGGPMANGQPEAGNDA